MFLAAVAAICGSAALDYYRENWTYQGLREQARLAQLSEEVEADEVVRSPPPPSPKQTRRSRWPFRLTWPFRRRKSKPGSKRSKRSSVSALASVAEKCDVEVEVNVALVISTPAQPKGVTFCEPNRPKPPRRRQVLKRIKRKARAAMVSMERLPRALSRGRNV